MLFVAARIHLYCQNKMLDNWMAEMKVIRSAVVMDEPLDYQQVGVMVFAMDYRMAGSLAVVMDDVMVVLMVASIARGRFFAVCVTTF